MAVSTGVSFAEDENYSPQMWGKLRVLLGTITLTTSAVYTGTTGAPLLAGDFGLNSLVAVLPMGGALQTDTPVVAIWNRSAKAMRLFVEAAGTLTEDDAGTVAAETTIPVMVLGT